MDGDERETGRCMVASEGSLPGAAKGMTQIRRKESKDEKVEERTRVRPPFEEKGAEDAEALAQAGAAFSGAPGALDGDKGGEGARRDERPEFANPGQGGLPVGGAADGIAGILDAPEDQGLVDHGDDNALMGGDVNEPVPVLMEGKAFAKGDGEEKIAGGKQGRGLHEAAGIEQSGTAEEIIGDRLGVMIEPVGEHAAAGGRLGDEARGDDRKPVAGLVDGVHLEFDFFGEPFVVVVEEGDPFAAGSTHAHVAGRGAAGVLREENDAQARIGERLEEGFRGEIGAVNDNDDLDAGPGLAQGAANGAGEQRGPAPRGNDGGDQRAIGGETVVHSGLAR